MNACDEDGSSGASGEGDTENRGSGGGVVGICALLPFYTCSMTPRYRRSETGITFLGRGVTICGSSESDETSFCLLGEDPDMSSVSTRVSLVFDIPAVQ